MTAGRFETMETGGPGDRKTGLAAADHDRIQQPIR